MKRLILVRHGQSVWNEARRFQGATDVPLSELGRRQAEALGRVLRGWPLGAAYVSPLARARETAEIALAGRTIPLVTLPELRELSLGAWEGLRVDDLRGGDPDPYEAWVRAPLDHPPPGAEPLEAVRRRVLAAVDRIAAAHPDGEDVLVVAHGGIISVYACHLLGLSFNALWRLRVDNGSLTVVEPPRLVRLNDTAHLGLLGAAAAPPPVDPAHARP